MVTRQPLGVIAGSSTAPCLLIDVHLLLCFSPLWWVFLMPVIAGQREAVKEIVQARLVEKQAGVWLCYRGNNTFASQ